MHDAPTHPFFISPIEQSLRQYKLNEEPERLVTDTSTNTQLRGDILVMVGLAGISYLTSNLVVPSSWAIPCSCGSTGN